MPRCVWEHTMRLVPGRGQEAVAQPHARCATHNWTPLGEKPSFSEDCPIGRIEEATETALAKIEAKMNSYLALGDPSGSIPESER